MFKREYDYNASIIWSLSGKCNLNCRYCVNPEVSSGKSNSINIKKLMRSLNQSGRIYHITFTGGGEPFLCPNFLEALEIITKKHLISISSNLTSPKIKEFSDKINPKKVTYIWASLHIDELKKKRLSKFFIENYRHLKKNGFNVIVGEVAYPPLMNRVKEIKDYYKKWGIEFIFQLYWGEYSGKSYPESYTNEELMAFGFEGKNNYLDQNQSYKKICNAGCNSISVSYDGDITPCGYISYNMGNIYDKIKFNNHLIICPNKLCTCPAMNSDPYLFNKAKDSSRDIRFITTNNKILIIINRNIGKIGLLINKYNPKLYYSLKKFKDNTVKNKIFIQSR